MSNDTSPSTTSIQIARRLVARTAAPGSDPAKVGAALQRTFVRVNENLRDSMGEDGTNALLARAFARIEAEHPALKNIRRSEKGGMQLESVIANVEPHGVAAVTAAIEALLAALVDILGRLIGEDMAIRIIDPDAAWSSRGDGARTT